VLSENHAAWEQRLDMGGDGLRAVKDRLDIAEYRIDADEGLQKRTRREALVMKVQNRVGK
jgi:hypothetical protein